MLYNVIKRVYCRCRMLYKLKKALLQSLPGRKVHLEMVPENRIDSFLKENVQQVRDAKKAAVLILLYEHHKEWYTVFIKRPFYDGVHSGQIAFPGGRYEPEDVDLIATSFREAEEEIGVIRRDIRFLGCLTEVYIPVSNYLILPVIGSINYVPGFIPDREEVADILQVSLKDLFNPENQTSVMIADPDNSNFNAPCFTIRQEIIWGATAMVVNELKWVFKSLNYPYTSLNATS